MRPKKRERFAPQGVLAILPSAVGQTYDTLLDENPGDVSALEEPQAPPVIPRVYIQGPLEHHGYCFASYDSIRYQLAYALQCSESPYVILDIDSPGGLVSGCFDCSREMRAMARAAGKKLIAYVNGMACSAAYSLACAADEIVVGQTSMVGSIGVIDCMVDATASDQQLGLKFAIITSGERKADGNPHTALTAQALAVSQARVDDLAQIFFAWVAEARGLTVEAVRALEAGISYGEKAVSLRLADTVSTLDQLVERLSTPNTEAKSDINMSYKDAKKALESVAADKDSTDEDKASAKKMLAAIEDDKKDDDKKDDKAAADDDKKDDDKKDDAKKASASVTSELAAITARLDAAERAGKIKGLLATRPDLTDAQTKAFRALSPEALVSVLLATPVNKPAEPAKPGAATAPTSPMAGALAAVTGEAPPSAAVAPTSYDEKRAKQRERMGLAAAPKAEIRKEGSTMIFDLCAPKATV